MSRLKALLTIMVIVLVVGCKREESTTPKMPIHYDYTILDELEIVVPPSGQPGRFIYIIGCNISDTTLRGTYYVSPTGNDTNPGTRALPWRTLAYAVQQLHPGDTLIVFAQEGRRPVIAGGNNVRAIFDISDCSYLWFENLEITHNENLEGEGKFSRDCFVSYTQNHPTSKSCLKNLHSPYRRNGIRFIGH